MEINLCILLNFSGVFYKTRIVLDWVTISFTECEYLVFCYTLWPMKRYPHTRNCDHKCLPHWTNLPRVKPLKVHTFHQAVLLLRPNLTLSSSNFFQALAGKILNQMKPLYLYIISIINFLGRFNTFEHCSLDIGNNIQIVCLVKLYYFCVVFYLNCWVLLARLSLSHSAKTANFKIYIEGTFFFNFCS